MTSSTASPGRWPERVKPPNSPEPNAPFVPPGSGWPEDPAKPDTPVAASPEEVQRLADQVAHLLPAGVPVHAVDANASWARPGTRLVDGVEELAAILHPAAAARTSG